MNVQRVVPMRCLVRTMSHVSKGRVLGGAPIRVEYIDRPPSGHTGRWESKFLWTTATFTAGCIGVGYLVAKFLVKEAKEVQSEFVSDHFWISSHDWKKITVHIYGESVFIFLLLN